MTDTIAVPLPVFAAVLKVLGQMPHEQVNPLIVELQKCSKIIPNPTNGPPTQNLPDGTVRSRLDAPTG